MRAFGISSSFWICSNRQWSLTAVTSQTMKFWLVCVTGGEVMELVCSVWNCRCSYISWRGCLPTILSHLNTSYSSCSHTHTHNRLTAFCRDNPGRLVPEETFTHSHPSWSSDILYKLPPFKYDPYHPPHSVYVLDSPFRQPLSRSSLVLDPLLHTPCISSPSHHLFAAHAHTITAYFSVIPMSSVPNLSLSARYLEICRSLMPHIHVTIVIISCWSATSIFPYSPDLTV